MMPTDNHTIFYPLTYILTGIPGTEESYFWISIPFCLMYFVTLFGNSLLIFIILTERRLHEPMYLIVSMLATVDLLLSTSRVPKMLAVFWFRVGEISFAACLTQMFFIHASFIAESAILLAMAFDRYIAICDPLRYNIILTKSVIEKMGLKVVTRSFLIIFPLIFLVKQQKFCRTNLLPHTYCEHMAITRLACDDITVSAWYGVAVAVLVIGLDAVLIVILMFYTPAFFSSLAHRFGHIIPGYILNLLANLYVLILPLLIPIVYEVTTKEILKCVINIFHRCISRSSLLS